MDDVTDRSAELMDRIAGTDDFYAILDVPRDADDVAIKKVSLLCACIRNNRRPGAAAAYALIGSRSRVSFFRPTEGRRWHYTPTSASSRVPKRPSRRCDRAVSTRIAPCGGGVLGGVLLTTIRVQMAAGAFSV